MLKYIALFETDEKADGVGVIFPDIPECISSGKNYEEAFKNAHEILAYILDEKKAAGEKLPKPRSMEQIMKTWEDWKEWKENYNFTASYVSYLPVAKPKKYTVYIDSALMERIDEVTDNRSAFLSKAAELLLN